MNIHGRVGSELLGLTSFGPDPADMVNAADLLDWREGWMAHDGAYFYLALRNDSDIVFNWAYNTYLDTDSNRATGFTDNLRLPLGAEFLITDNTLFQYTGDGTNWSWNFVATLETAVAGTDVELAFPRSAIGSPVLMRLFFYGDNHAYPGGSALDLYPDEALEPVGDTRYFEYSTIP